MELEHILVFFESQDGVRDWKPVDREQIPDWVRTPEIIDRLIAGEKVRNTAERVHRYFRAVEIDRPRPAGQLAARKAAMAEALALSAGGIQLLH
ncbi:MAG: hypothetical protein M0Z99_33890 [Betaproteobacteria bacterium]|nr:hypothetical protein [Betaproteobacteria bacterium]